MGCLSILLFSECIYFLFLSRQIIILIHKYQIIYIKKHNVLDYLLVTKSHGLFSCSRYTSVTSCDHLTSVFLYLMWALTFNIFSVETKFNVKNSKEVGVRVRLTSNVLEYFNWWTCMKE